MGIAEPPILFRGKSGNNGEMGERLNPKLSGLLKRRFSSEENLETTERWVAA
jgi:hypothetical protein